MSDVKVDKLSMYYRDGRLRTNDQLLYINGMSLIGQTNAAAMEILRRTMMNVDPGPIPGAISLTVARRRNTSPNLHRRRSRDSSSSLLTDSSGYYFIRLCTRSVYYFL